MPELPEVETVVRELRKKIKNKTIAKVHVLLPKMVALGPKVLPNIRVNSSLAAGKLAKLLTNKKITAVSRRAKLIIIDLEGKLSLLVHLKMTGQLIFLKHSQLTKSIRLFNTQNHQPVALPAKSTHVIFEFTDKSKLFYNDFRQFGYLKLVTDKELAHVPELLGYGPEPLDKSFTFPKFQKQLLQRRNAYLKLWLMDPRNIAGIGNIYSDEILYQAKLRPTRRVKSLATQEQKSIYKSIYKILSRAVKLSGSSVGDFVRPGGNWGTYGLQHKVYAKAGDKCQKCGSIIKSIKFNGRTGSYCPTEQK